MTTRDTQKEASIDAATVLVGCYTSSGTHQLLPVSGAELMRAQAFVLRLLSTFHFRTGEKVLVTSELKDVVQSLPFERAVMAYGMVVCSADSTFFDAARVESILRRFQPVAVMGLSGATLEGLQAAGHAPVELLQGPVIWARPCAYEKLEGSGLNIRAWREIGPAVGMECEHANGLHFDRFEWEVETKDDELMVTSRLQRAQPFMRHATGVHGRIDFDACPCGNSDPRVIIV